MWSGACRRPKSSAGPFPLSRLEGKHHPGHIPFLEDTRPFPEDLALAPSRVPVQVPPHGVEEVQELEALEGPLLVLREENGVLGTEGAEGPEFVILPHPKRTRGFALPSKAGPIECHFHHGLT